MKHYAFVDRHGVIGFATYMPYGMLPIADDPSYERLHQVIEPLARRAYGGTLLLVPGVLEADGPEDAIAAVLAFNDQVRSRLSAVAQ